MMKTSVAALLAAFVVGGVATSAAACEYRKQVMAKAATPVVEEKTEASATPVDPVRLAELERVNDQSPVAK